MLQNKPAVIYGGGGAIGGAVARGFADAGARVYLAGRSRPRLARWAEDVTLLGRYRRWPRSPMRRSSWRPTAPRRSPARWST
jgi:NAD(P)-dependent dehydrogenase (short-subunit alcohol dehydrogenase family)